MDDVTNSTRLFTQLKWIVATSGSDLKHATHLNLDQACRVSECVPSTDEVAEGETDFCASIIASADQETPTTAVLP